MVNNWKTAIYVEAYTALNLGDDLFLHALFTRYPHTNFCMKGNKTYSSMFENYYNVKVIDSLVVKALYIADEKLHINEHSTRNRLASKCKAAVLIGGSLFIEPYIPQFTNKLYQDKPLFLLGANFGPYSSKSYLDYCTKYLTMFYDACFRDRKTYQTFKRLKNCRYAPDIVFSYVGKHINTKKSGQGVAISVMDFEAINPTLGQYQKEYEILILQIIKLSISKNLPVNLISFCEREGDWGEIQKLITMLPENMRSDIHTFSYKGNNHDQIIGVINDSEYVVGTRFHSIILGLSLQKKILPISYSVKTDELLKDLELADFILPIAEINSASTILRWAQISESKLQEVVKQADLQFQGLDAFLMDEKGR